jgi:hypothetical protein
MRNKNGSRVARNFAWLPDGPIQKYFQEQVQSNFLRSRFDASGELMAFHDGHALAHEQRSDTEPHETPERGVFRAASPGSRVAAVGAIRYEPPARAATLGAGELQGAAAEHMSEPIIDVHHHIGGRRYDEVVSVMRRFSSASYHAFSGSPSWLEVVDTTWRRAAIWRH